MRLETIPNDMTERQKMRHLVRSLVLSIAVTVCAPITSLTAGEKWDMPMAYAPGNFHSQTAMMFAKAVQRATNGELEIVVHAGGSLFSGGEIKRAVQTGQAQIGERLMSALSNENPIFGIDAVPFLATSFDQAWRLYQSSKPEIERLLAEQNLVLLYATPWPPQGLYADRAINAVRDMRGMKFRAYNPATSRLAQLMGATPTQIETAELSQALATGVANSLITSGATGVDRKVWEHLSHFYNLQAWLPKNMVFVNKEAWDDLDQRTRDLVRGAAAMAEAAGWARSEELADQYLVTLQENGMSVLPPSEELARGVKEIGKKMTEEWLEEAGSAGQGVLSVYRSNRQFAERR